MSKKITPVVVGLSGGLGNQMFQYSAGRALALKLGTQLLLDCTWFLGRSDRDYALGPFNIVSDTSSGIRFLPDSLCYQQSRLSRRWANRRMGVPVFRESHFHFNSEFNSISQPVFLEGYWQSERYFNVIRENIVQEFTLASAMPQNCQSMLNQIKACQSICVHVRRGDYVIDPVAVKVHGVCAIDYYQHAVAELAKTLERPHCFIFSDDPEWVRNSLDISYSSTVVDINSAEDAHWDLMLMSMCDHFVIANSSLSWWGAWLGKHPDKRVVAPSRWFLNSDKDTTDLIPDSWERV